MTAAAALEGERSGRAGAARRPGRSDYVVAGGRTRDVDPIGSSRRARGVRGCRR